MVASVTVRIEVTIIKGMAITAAYNKMTGMATRIHAFNCINN
ncbi:hypothetical protein [Pleurocapsa sp. CCALA 161]|nr:hypothetical protein [Pleurocapsa sp. CCALA 161]